MAAGELACITSANEGKKNGCSPRLISHQMVAATEKKIRMKMGRQNDKRFCHREGDVDTLLLYLLRRTRYIWECDRLKWARSREREWPEMEKHCMQRKSTEKRVRIVRWKKGSYWWNNVQFLTKSIDNKMLNATGTLWRLRRYGLWNVQPLCFFLQHEDYSCASACRNSARLW